jgi:hypothetical protein
LRIEFSAATQPNRQRKDDGIFFSVLPDRLPEQKKTGTGTLPSQSACPRFPLWDEVYQANSDLILVTYTF